MLLNCHTYYSFCYGTYSIPELLHEIVQKGYSSFVLTDINNTSACLETIRLIKQEGHRLKPILGIDFRNNHQQQYVGIAKNNEGFQELNEHLTYHLHHHEEISMNAPIFENAFIIYPFAMYRGQALRDNEFIGISINDLATLHRLPIRYMTNKLVALQQMSFAGKRQFNMHRLLRAIDTNTLLSKLPPEQQATGTELMPDQKTMYELYADWPDIVKNTETLLNTCMIDFEYGKLKSKNIECVHGSVEKDIAILREASEKGLKERYPTETAEVRERLEKELDVIKTLNFTSYYLANREIIQYARQKKYYYVGRGSGANSLVAYLLYITDVDPIELDLYFERFINIYRKNAPDFDIDFSWTDRDDITRFMFERFGYQHTALLGAYNTFQQDAVIRELGKVFGLPSGDIDRLQRIHKEDVTDEIERLILHYSKLLHGFPSHLSIHSSGILISHKPISWYSATNMPPKGYPTTQFSMMEAEDIGLFKFDILSQRGLGKIKDSLEIIEENLGIKIDVHDMSTIKTDERVRELMRKGNTIGCFYVESPAMRMLLAKLNADDYLRLVAASSIIRPGVSKSGMMREYILRYREPDLREKARAQLPKLYELLEETYGVMVYQEDVIKIAHLFARLTLAEADVLRRGMSWKFKERNEFSKVKDKFFSNCAEDGHEETMVRDIWTQIESFANFAFSKGHSASYAVESFQAMFLKAYYPIEYMVATLNNGGGFYRKDLYIHEARMHGATIKAPCVNHSKAICVLRDTTIYLGLNMISELETDSMKRILMERERNGPYNDLYHFVNRVGLPIEQMRLLIRSGCFNFSMRSKKELLWEIHAILQPVSRKKQHEELFVTVAPEWKLPELTHSDIEEAFDEIELFGFPLCSPFQLLQDALPCTLKASQLKDHIDKEVRIAGYLINVKQTRTHTGESMCFGTFIDMDGYWIDTVHFPPVKKLFPFTGPGCYEIGGKVMAEFDFICIEVNYLKRLPMKDRDRV